MPLPGNGMQPFDRTTAARIARPFLPPRWYGNRYDYYYALAKLRTDPLYPGALAALRGSSAPILDLGCGLGLFAHALRADGQRQAYLGVDIDAGKVARAARFAAGGGLDGAHFETCDLDTETPAHAGSVALLDVLQYLPQQSQRRILAAATAMLTPGARLVIRTGLHDDSHRSRATRVTDHLGHMIGWMQVRPRQYPNRESLRSQLEAAGLSPEFRPLYGDTPFNNWLVVAERL